MSEKIWKLWKRGGNADPGPFAVMIILNSTFLAMFLVEIPIFYCRFIN
jgi:hypothetical protein